MLVTSPLCKDITHLSLREQYRHLNKLYSKNRFIGLVECCSCTPSLPQTQWLDPEIYKWRRWILENIILKLGDDNNITTSVKIRIATGLLNNIISLCKIQKIKIHNDLIIILNKEMNKIIDEELPF